MSTNVNIARPPEPNMPLTKSWLVGGGEMGELIRSMDWSKTPLGPLESWPNSLRTTVNLCLASNFPINIVWGPGHVQIYNDGYRVVVGDKHPAAMGMDYAECWASAWPAIGGPFERGWQGETSFLENQRMFLQRNAYMEETFFTFSLSPIRDETGTVAGLFHPVTETTGKMLIERRTGALHDLAAHTSETRNTDGALSSAAATLMLYEFDLPMMLLYALDDSGKQARLAGCTGIEAGTVASPKLIEIGGADSFWPLAEIIASGSTVQLDNVRHRFGAVPCGPYPEQPNVALARAIMTPGSDHPVAVLIAGISPRLPLNQGYYAFYSQLVSSITAAVTNARAYEQERKRAEALAEIDRAKTEFFSNVSHEFRTPLTLMLGPLEDELAEQEAPLPTARHERLETAHRNSLRLLKLVNTLLDFSRMEAGRAQASYEPTDLSTYTKELSSLFRSAIEKAGLTLTQNCEPLPEPIYVDREMWEKIVLNLLSNAFKHTFEGGISVTMRWQKDHVELLVADTGVGIPEEAKSSLFERFRRVKGAKSRSHEGTGIGLALVQELVALHGGTVRVESEEGKGSIFIVSVKAGTEHLPPERIGAERQLAYASTRASAYVEEALHWLPDTATVTEMPVVEANHLPAGVKSSVSPANEARAQIIWADDNADMREYVRRLLAEHYHVTAVPDGLAALAAAREKTPDLVLSDVMMPELDGFGLLHALRETDSTRMVPVILLSARAGEESALEGLDAGADDYLVKPFSARELLARVRTHLQLSRLRQSWAKELEHANQELEAFSYSVSHDLRTPLRAIDGFSKALIEDYGPKMDEQAIHYLNRVRSGTQRMASLIDDLLSLSRIGRSRLLKQPINVTTLAREVMEDLHQKDPERPVHVEIEEGLTANADVRFLKIVLTNLLGNAWKYSSKQPDTCISLTKIHCGDEMVFCVRDNGIGFDMAHANKLFVPFQRLHHESEFEGTGIGLATVQRIITHHGGRIWAEAELEKGAAFLFTLENAR